MDLKNSKIAVIGLGYVGLPLLIHTGKKYDCVGYDINIDRVNELRNGADNTREVSSDELRSTNVKFTNDAEDIRDCNIKIVTVPTPIDSIIIQI